VAAAQSDSVTIRKAHAARLKEKRAVQTDPEDPSALPFFSKNALVI
jgi:hypothetical protein